MEGLIVHAKGDIRPIPDPTDLTTKRIEDVARSQADLFETKLNAIDRIIEERFTRIDQLFAERDKRTDQQMMASAKAIEKAEISTSGSIRQLQELFQTSISALSAQVGDLKSRLDKGEGQGSGAKVAKEEINDNSARMYSVVAIIVAVFVGIGQIYGSFTKSDRDQVLFDSVSKLQADQLNFAKNSAKSPVEKSDVELLSQRLDALSNRLNNFQVTPRVIQVPATAEPPK